MNKKLLGFLISCVLIGIIAVQTDLEKTINSFTLMNPVYILPIIPVYLLSFIIRAFRWRVFLCDSKLKFNSLLSSIFIGFSLNCVLPARAGEIYRAYFFSKREGLPKTRVFTSVILERIFDGLTLFVILLGAIYFISPGELFFKIALSSGIIFLGGFLALITLVKMQKTGDKRKKLKQIFFNLAETLPQNMELITKKTIKKTFLILNSFIEGLKTLNSSKLLFKTIFYSFLIWLMEGAFVLLVIKSFGVNISLIGSLLVLAVTAFSTLIPAGPAGIGPYQWGYIIALKVFGITTELAFAVSVINQILAILLVLTTSVILIYAQQINLNEFKYIPK